MMRTFEFTPAMCAKNENGDDPKYTGTVTLIVPTSSEKLELLEQIGIQVDESGEAKPTQGGLTTTAKMIKASEKFYKEVKITRSEDSTELKTFDDLHYEGPCLPIMIEIAQRLFSGGIKVSKN